MPVRASDLRKTVLNYMREEREKLKTYEVPCRVVSPQNPRGDKPFMRIHVSGSLQVRCRRDENWHHITRSQYEKRRETALSWKTSCDLYAENCGKQKKVGWVDSLGLYATYCPYCHKLGATKPHMITHQEYDCAIFLLKMRAKEEMERRKIAEAELAQGMKQTLGWRAARLAGLGESLWVPQISNLGTQLAGMFDTANVYHNMVGAAFEGMNVDMLPHFSGMFEPALGHMINSITGVAATGLFSSASQAVFGAVRNMVAPVTLATFENLNGQMQGFDLVSKSAGTRISEALAASVRPIEILPTGTQLAALSSISKIVATDLFAIGRLK